MTMKRIAATWIICLATSFAGMLGGCGASGSRVTGLPRDAQLKNLTASDLRSACLNLYKTTPGASDNSIRASCVLSLSANGQENCNAQLETCMTMSKAAIASNVNSTECDKASTTDTTPYASCGATVGELEDCLSETYDAFEKYAGTITCASPEPTGALDPLGGPACTRFTSKCPGVLDDETSPA